MNITDIIFRKTFDSGKLRAIASITLDGCFAIHEIKGNTAQLTPHCHKKSDIL